MSDCEDYYLQINKLASYIQAGKIAVNEAARTQCLSSMRQLFKTCTDFPRQGSDRWYLRDVPGCLQMYVGTIPLGAPCKTDGECPQPGSALVRCIGADADSLHCRAVPVGKLGDPCLMTSGPTFNNFIPGQSDSGHAECRRADGLFCKAITASQFQCAAVTADGSPCSSSNECGAASYCTCTPGSSCSGTCQPLKQTGQACTTSDECAGFGCGSVLPTFDPTKLQCVDRAALTQTTCEQTGLLQ